MVDAAKREEGMGPERRSAAAWARGALVLAALLLTVPTGCARLATPIATAPSPGEGWTEEGVASWYGDPYHGRATASGETYDMEALTTAHRTLPFGTIVLVENLESGERITLRINDRGPFVRGRVLDVSRRSARDLGMIGPGTAPVRITVLTATPEIDCWEVQAGAFELRENADRLRAELEADGHPARLLTALDGLHRVRLGPFASPATWPTAWTASSSGARSRTSAVRARREPARGAPGLPWGPPGLRCAA
ncbi:MAG: septal ring lytic transglycosylase RlpA family protein [Gemmatimonadetes bacterium]|nr:septal ring lytic transglycosylase RlpA family protein [Gemmatimonadota bacterium]